MGEPGFSKALTSKAPVFGAKRRGIIVESLAPCQALSQVENHAMGIGAGVEFSTGSPTCNFRSKRCSACRLRRLGVNVSSAKGKRVC